MGNLVEIKRDFIVNKVAADKFGVYTDSQKSEKVLMLKDLGYSIFAHGTANKDFGVITAEASVGVTKIGLYQLNNAAPSDPTAYDVTVKIDPKKKVPGKDGPMYLAAGVYGGTYNVPVSGSVITEAGIKVIVDSICEQVYSDDANDYALAGMAFIITDWVTNKKVTINGTEYTNATLAGLKAAINAGTLAYAYDIDTAAAPTATSLVVLLRTAYVSLTVEADLVLSDSYLGLVAKTVDTSFDTYFESQGLKSSLILRAHVYPFMTNDEIDAIVRNFGSHGDLYMFGGTERPTKGVTYLKYYIWGSSDAYDNATPGGGIKHTHGLNLYVPKTEAAVNYFKSTAWNSDAPSAPDRTLTQLLAYWLS